MINQKTIWPILVRYLNNTLSDEDTKTLEEWLEADHENRRTLQTIDQIWKATEEKAQGALLNELNLEKDWDRIADYIQPGQDSIEPVKRNPVRVEWKRKKHGQLLSNVLKAAALILVAVTSAFLTLQYASTENDKVYEPVFREITTNPGERVNIHLGEGTRVLLNADSKLIMPETFRSDRREVELKGQAFFDVQTDGNRPFFIKTGGAVVEVLGTSFDVRSYDDENEIRIVVRDGTVEFRDSDNEENRLTLRGGTLGSLTKDAGELTMQVVEDLDLYLSWLEGRFVFKDADFPDVLRQIERWYDVEIVLDLSDNSLLEKKFTADIKTRSVKDFLEVIGMSMDIRYEVEEDKIFIMN